MSAARTEEAHTTCDAVHVSDGGPACSWSVGHAGPHSWQAGAAETLPPCAPKRERWCERCEMWLSPKLVDVVDHCYVHQCPTETSEQIRRDRDEYRSTAAQVSHMADAYRAATGEDYRTVARLRADLAEARARLDAVGEVLSANGCDCPCECPAGEHDDDCSRCLACRVETAAFGRGER